VKHTIAFALALGVFASGLAMAQATKSYSEPKGRFSIIYPAKWPADLMSKPDSPTTEFVVGGADAECWFIGIDRAEWASAKPTDVRRTFSEKFTDQKLLEAFEGRILSGASKDTPAKVVASSVETLNNWPVQFGEIQAGTDRLMVAIHTRPGFEARSFCKAYDGKDHNAEFKAVALSLTAARDAEWEAQAQEWEAKKAAASAANAEVEKQKAEQEAKKAGKKPRKE
jgi:hypothetical protein